MVGDDSTIRVHIHTLDPGEILRYVASLGTMHEINIRNIDEQHQDFLEMQKGRELAVDVATVAVAAGGGLTDIFKAWE